MKASIILCLVFIASMAYGAPPANFLVGLKIECAEENNVTVEQLQKLKADNFKTDNKNIKCFAKCVLNKTGVLSDNGLDVEKFVSFPDLTHKDPAVLRENADKCKAQFDLFKGGNDCESAMSMLACFKFA